MTTLDCIGSGNAFSNGQYWNGFLLDRRVLLDCPAQTLTHLQKLDLEIDQLDLILLSHQHSDHVIGMDLLLLELTMGRASRSERPLRIAAPPGVYERVAEIIGGAPRMTPKDDDRITWIEMHDGASFEWEGVTVQAVEVDHMPELFLAVGYRVEIDGKLIAYTGDTKICDAVYTLAEGADLLVLECGGGPPHMNWDDIHKLRDDLPASTQMLVTHYNGVTAPDVSAIDGLSLAEDFASYEL